MDGPAPKPARPSLIGVVKTPYMRTVNKAQKPKKGPPQKPQDI
jgi:hypothetical protein